MVPSTAQINPLDLAGLGVAEGTEVQVVGTRGTVVLPLEADRAVPRGSLRVPFNVPGASIADIIDARAPANDVRVERM
jgi:anaerobic selenocysteine-containing dehydrogenase